jgi:hypothetical protein
MADTNPFPRTVASITREGRGPQTHAYDDPNLSAKEFLLAVMHDRTLPLATRIKAASAAAPYFPSKQNEFVPRCIIIIPPLNDFQGSGCEPRTPANEFSAEDPDAGSTANHSQNPFGAQITVTRDAETQAPQNLTRYSDPPSPEEIQQVAAAVHRLRPDLAHLPVTAPHLCRCGHWIFGPCPLAGC